MSPGLSSMSTGVPARMVVSMLLLGAGVIHFIETPNHFAEDELYGWFFVAMGLAQTLGAITVAIRPSRTLLIAVVVGSAGILGVWAITRTIGIPVGAEAGSVESVGRIDLVAGLMELATIGLAGWLVLSRPGARLQRIPVALTGLAMIGLVSFAVAGRREACRHFDPDLGPLVAVDGHSILPRGMPPAEVAPGETINVKAGLLVNCGSDPVVITRAEVISDSGASAAIESFEVLTEHHKDNEISSHHAVGELVKVAPTDDHAEMALFASVRGLGDGSYFLNGVRINYMYRGRSHSQVFATAVTIRVGRN